MKIISILSKKQTRPDMNQIKSLIQLLVIVPIFFISSCEKQLEVKQEGTLELGIFLEQMDGQLKSALGDSSHVKTHFVVISVVNENGELVLDHERQELYNFGGQWTTKEITLKVGRYEVVKFLVVDWEGNVLLAAPVEGSSMAYLVDDPLPLPFEIQKNQTSRVTPEVLAVNEQPPEAFGYVTFGYNVVKTLDFHVAVFIDDPRIMAPSKYTEAELTIIIDSVWRHSFKLEAKVNRLRVRESPWNYVLIANKEGFAPKKLVVSREELLKTSPDNPLLIGLPVKDLQVLVLQPGPDEGKDAMISRSLPDDNFGKFPFFEATVVAPVTSDVQHKLTRSLIEFDLNQLPKSARIKRAILTLYYPNYDYTDSVYPVKPLSEGQTGYDTIQPSPADYLAVLQRVISPWQEHEVTWEKQPETTTENQVFIPRIYYIMDASCNCFVPPVSETIDVTALLMPDASGTMQYGMLLKLVNEENQEWLRFASSDYEMITASNQEPIKRWPKLEIYYTIPTL
jgi:hypothetical protein